MRSLIFTLLLITGGICTALAQYNVVVFAEQGEKFYLILNGVRQNDDAQTNVKVTDLNQPMYTAKIIFEDSSLGEMDKKLMFPEVPSEVTYVIKTNRKGEYVLRYQTQVPIAQAPPPTPQQQVVVYHSQPNPQPASNVTVTEQTTTTTTVTSGGTTTRENVNVGMSVPGANVNMNINVNDGMGTGSNVHVQETHTTTTTTTSQPAQPAQPDHYVMPGYSGPIGCPWPMTESQFASARNSISSKTFEDSKLTTARQVAGANCLTADQVRDIMNLFTYEDSKLEFAKFAYGNTYDIGNYYKVNDAFTYELSIDELNEHINGGGSDW